MTLKSFIIFSSEGRFQSTLRPARRVCVSTRRAGFKFVAKLHRGHFAARFSAFTARLNALFHLADGFARLRARFANVGAFGADVSVMSGAAQHEVGAGLADLRAVHHQAEVIRLSVLATHFQTVAHRFVQAHTMALRAVLDTLLHLLIHVFVIHFFSPPRLFKQLQKITQLLWKSHGVGC